MIHANRFRVAPIFQNHAVLQRDTPIPVWGHAEPGATITARFADAPEARTTVNDDGTWLLRLPPVPAGGPHTLAIASSGGEQVMFSDILSGDVWVCSGQSNMEFGFASSSGAATHAPAFDLPHLRFLTVNTPAKADRQSAVGGIWAPSTQVSVMPFSAVAAWFGKELHEKTGIPIGLIANAWGGTRIQAWLSREALATIPETRAELAIYESDLYSDCTGVKPAYRNADEWFRAEGPENPANLGADHGWHLPAFDIGPWQTMELPCRWQMAGHDFNGIFWFRRSVTIPRAWLGKNLQINLGAIDKHDDTYVNGTRIGGMSWENPNSWCTPRHYTIPASTIAGTELAIAVRVRSHLYHGGMTGPSLAMNLHPEGDPSTPIPLAGPWRYAVEQNWGTVTPPTMVNNAGPGGQNAPYTLHASRLAPLIPYAIRGFTWYQGESNTAEPALYRRLLPLMIGDWRRAWGQGDLPFLIVQLANYMPAQENPAESDWAELRDAQLAALSVPNTGLAVTLDIGDPADIHPTNKRDVGLRLAHWALSQTYAKGGPPSGPLFRRAERLSSGGVRIFFDHADGLRTTCGGPVRHIAIAGSDGEFRWATAAIEGNALIVSHPDIPVPVAVRYAWADNPEGCNLTNAEGLPASPFQTRDF